jgi:hypothetical protein
MQPALRSAVTLLLTTTTTLLRAQGSGYSSGGTELSSRVSTSYLAASLTEASRETRWLQFVVLWRGQSGWSQGRQRLDTAMLRKAQTAYNTARHAALARDGVFIGGQSGGVAYTAEADSARVTLTVLGQRFSIPRRDSALIVMVDRIDGVGGDPIVAGTRVVESRLPEVPAERTWTSGDTTFIVRPRGRETGSDRANIESVLERDSTVAAFWRADSFGGPTDVLVPVSPRTVTSASPADFRPALAAVDGPFECTGREAIGQSAMGRLLVGADAIAYTAAFPSKSDTKATVVVMVDSTGKIVRYSERRGPPLRPAANPGNSDARRSADALAAAVAAVRSTNITMDYRAGSATVANMGGGRPDERMSGPIDVMGSMQEFGKPLDRAQRVLAQCAGTPK